MFRFFHAPNTESVPRPQNAKEWAIAIGFLISIITLWKLVWTPTKSFVRWIAKKTVLGVLQRCHEEVRRIFREDVFVEEVKLWEETHTVSHANKDTISAVFEAQKAQGVAMLSIEKELKRFELVPDTLDRLHGAMDIIGGDLKYIRGRLEERDGVPWDGDTERRKKDTGRDEGERRGR